MQQSQTTNGATEGGGAMHAPIPQAGGSTSPNYVPPPMPPMQGGGSTMQQGGETTSGAGSSYGGNFKAFFGDINWLDIAISSFIIAAMAYSIKYHKYMLMIEKSGYTNLNDRLQSLEGKVNKKIAEMNATGGKMRRRAVVRL